MKVNITYYNKNDLSHLVFNTYDLYKNINDIKKLIQLIDNRYIYTSEQFNILKNDINEYLK
tara:strand:- start:894 stop:1076 length:183 start_codon:yes stop_codon:yes gene_type:complete